MARLHLQVCAALVVATTIAGSASPTKENKGSGSLNGKSLLSVSVVVIDTPDGKLRVDRVDQIETNGTRAQWLRVRGVQYAE
jgi:hypothetical protein